jgi:integrase
MKSMLKAKLLLSARLSLWQPPTGLKQPSINGKQDMGRPSKGGAHKTTKRLADGSTIVYWYAYKGGPRLPGEPGTREFKDALKTQRIGAREIVAPSTKTLLRIVDGYLDSPEFLKRAERTKLDYRKLLRLVVADFGQMPLTALEAEASARGAFLRWRDRLAKGSYRQADYAWTVLNIILNWAKVRGEIKVNPCRDAGVRKLYGVTRKDRIWSREQIEAFCEKASNELALAMTLAVWTGQRQGDLLRLPWSAYDGQDIKLAQGKSGGLTKVIVPVGRPLKQALDLTLRRSPLILVNQDGVPWTPDGFRVMWRKTCIRAGVKGVTFHDLRGTAVTKLALAGATEPEIVSITGHAMAKVRSILDANYLHRDPRLARSAIAKLEAFESDENDIPNRVQPIDLIEAKKARFGKLSQ